MTINFKTPEIKELQPTISNVMGVALASISNVIGVASANISNVIGVDKE